MIIRLCVAVLWVLSGLVSGQDVDVCLAIDRSDTISATEWTQQLEFVARLAAEISNSSRTYRFGLVSFDEVAFLDIPLFKHTNLISLQEDIRSQRYSGHGRDIAAGLYRVREECFTYDRGDRANISNVAMLVTDGTSDWLYATEEARLLREKNSTILSVGVGPYTDWNLLVDISNYDVNVFEVANFATLQDSPAIAINRVLAKETTVYPDIISPTLSGPRVDGHHFYFECSIQYVAETQYARYLITFLFDGLPGNAPTVELAPPDTVAGLHDYFIRGQIGKNVSCMVESYWAFSKEKRSPTLTSSSYHMGIKASKTSVEIAELAGSLQSEETVYFYSTMPILCNSGSDCHLDMIIVTPPYIVTAQNWEQDTPKICTYTLSDADLNNVDYVNNAGLLITPSRYQYGANYRASGTVVMTTNPSQYTLNSTSSYTTDVPAGVMYSPWNGYTAPAISVTVHGAGNLGQCESVTDPRITTYDRRGFDALDVAAYRLTEYKLGNILVQEQHMNCGSWWCTKNCAVAVREQPTRDTERTHIIDVCNGQINVLRCQDEDTHRITRKGMTFTIRTGSGIEVQVTVVRSWPWPWSKHLNIYVNVPAALGNKMEGLCGNFNDNRTDDFDCYGIKSETTFKECNSCQKCGLEVPAHFALSVSTAHPMAHSSSTPGTSHRSDTALGVAVLPDTSFLLTNHLAELTQFVSKELVPTETYNATLGKAMDEVASYLKEGSTLRVKEVFKGGSAGKATVVRHKSDIDSVVFLNDFSGKSDSYKQEITKILPGLETALRQYNKQGLKSRVDVTGTTPFAVQIKLNLCSGTDGEEIDLDILPAYDYLAEYGETIQSKAKLYQMMNSYGKEERRYFYSALSPLQVDFIKHRPPSFKNLTRLVKYWRKTHFEVRPTTERLPTSYVLELVTVHSWQRAGEPEQFDLGQGFKAVINELQNPGNIACQWNYNYEISIFQETISKLKEDARKFSTPFILDPANPFNNTAAGLKTWNEVANMARLSLQKMSDVQLTPGWK